jgi:hypothetical protein
VIQLWEANSYLLSQNANETSVHFNIPFHYTSDDTNAKAAIIKTSCNETMTELAENYQQM